jgi:hypothetical protein
VKDTIDEFVNQKKQMFRVELANSQLKLEIENLNKKSDLRKKALVTSTKELRKHKEEVE